jgi:hypothetical protein
MNPSPLDIQQPLPAAALGLVDLPRASWRPRSTAQSEPTRHGTRQAPMRRSTYSTWEVRNEER